MDRLLSTQTIGKNFISGLFNQFQKKKQPLKPTNTAVTSWHFFLDDWLGVMYY